MARLIARHPQLRWLEPPKERGQLTVKNVLAAADHNEHFELVERWARDVWQTWSEHHATVQLWVAETLATTH